MSFCWAARITRRIGAHLLPNELRVFNDHRSADPNTIRTPAIDVPIADGNHRRGPRIGRAFLCTNRELIPYVVLVEIERVEVLEHNSRIRFRWSFAVEQIGLDEV